MGEALSKVEIRSDCLANVGSTPLEWYAIQTGYRYEHRVARDLYAKGFEIYLPLLREEHQWKDRKKQVDIPAFGGYLFVRQDASARHRVQILETTGVVRLLGDNHRPTPVPGAEIEALRRALHSGIPCSRCDYLAIGTVVRVKRGPLSGVEGRLVRIKGGLRLVLAIATVSQAISVEVHLEDVEPMGESQTS